MAISIMLDAGHGGINPGAVYKGRLEKDDNLALTMAVGNILEDNGLDVKYTRTTDIYQSPIEKAQIANKSGVDYFVSIHRNSFPEENAAAGVESLVYNLSGIKYEMAENIDAELAKLGFRDLGVKARPNLIVLKRTKMPSVLVEAGFVNSDTDNKLFDDKFEDIAKGIADGILKTVGASSDGAKELYSVQVGAFRNRSYAENLQRELMKLDFPARIEEGDGYYRVRVGSFSSLDEAGKLEQRLKRTGYQTVIVT